MQSLNMTGRREGASSRGLGLLTLALVIAIPGVAIRSAPPVAQRLKFASQAPERSAWGKALAAVAGDVERESSGQVKLKFYPGGVQGDERTVLRKLRIGQLHGAVLIGHGVTQVCPSSLVLSLPMLFQNTEEASHVFEIMRPEFEEHCRKAGYEVLGWPEFGFSYLFSQREVMTIAVLRDSKPWLIENDPMSENLYDALKINPVPTGIANVLPSLQTGLIRTIFAPPAGLVAMQWHTRVKYHLDVRLTYSMGTIVITKKRWGRLAPKTQELLKRVTAKRNAELSIRIRRQNREAMDVIRRNGVETIQIVPDSREMLAQARDQVGERLVGKYYSRQMLEKVKKLLDEYRASAKNQ